MDDARRADYERLVRQWSAPVYALACRMLRDRTAADDATQDVFVRVGERIDQYDPSRPFQPWIYRLATRVVLNRIRGERTRAGKEAAAAARPFAHPPEDAVERHEREQLVQQALARLDPESRSVLAMHYDCGLTQEQVAEVLDVPRSTAQSRIGRALDALRDALRRAGHFAVVPYVDDVLRSSTPPPVPDALVASLLDVGASGALVTLPVLGGLLVTKKLLLAASIVAALGVAGGFAAGYAASRPRSAEAGRDGSPLAEIERLTEENRRLAAQVAHRDDMPAVLASGGPRRTGSPAAGAPDHASAATGADSKSGPAGGDPAAADVEVDWSKFATLFAANAEKLLTLDDQGDRMKPADRQMVMGLLAEFMRVSANARALSPHPFFDPRVLPGLVVSVYGETLGMSSEARASLSETLSKLVSESAKSIDLEQAGPVETFVARQRAASEVLAAVVAAAGPSSRERFEKFRPIGESMLSGDHREIRLAWDGKATASSVGERVLAKWKQTYGLDERQMDAVRPIADRYARDAIDVLVRRGADKPDAKISDEASHAAGLEMMGFQAGAEKDIHRLLSDKQREDARGGPPTLLVVMPGESDSESQSNWGGI